MNKGNPYKKNNGKFGSLNDHDYILYEPNKENDIARNKEEAGNIREQHKSYNPVDITHKHIHSRMTPSFKDSTQNQYNNLDISKYKKDIQEVDLNNEQAVVELSRRMINDDSAVCFRTAAGVARILDERGIKYKVRIGYAEIPKTQAKVEGIKEAEKMSSNHVWIETEKGKTYSWFAREYSNNTKFYTITDSIELTRKERIIKTSGR